MSDRPARRHALAAFARGQRAADAAANRVELYAPRDYLNLRGDPRDSRFVDAASAALEVALPAGANTVARTSGRSVFWLGPDEWLIETGADSGGDLAAALHENLNGAAHAVTRLDGGMVALRLAGPDARDILAMGTTLDLDPRVFGPGHCAQTGLAKAAVLIACLDSPGGYDVLVRRSFADYLARWLGHAGAEFGIRFILAE